MSSDIYKLESNLSNISSSYKELGECLDTIIDHRGKTPKKLGGDWINSGIMAVSAKNVKDGKLVNDESPRYVSYEIYKKWMKEDVKSGDCFLVSEGATLGECMYWDFDFPIVLSQRIFCIRVNKDILYPKYFYAYMNTESFQSEIIGRSTGSSVSGLRQTELLKMKILILPMKDQKFIGDILYQLNKKIQLNIQTNINLEAIAQALFKSWFVDFDPVRAKQDGREPDGMDAATAGLFTDSFEESELGLVPKGWKVMLISDFAKVKHGFAFSGDFINDLSEGDILLTPGNFKVGGGFKDSKFKFYNGTVPSEYILSPFDLIVTMTDLSKAADTLGYPAFVPKSFDGKELLHNQRIGKVIVEQNSPVTKHFLYALMKTAAYRHHVVSGATGTTVKHTSPSRILAHKFICPSSSLDLISKFESLSEALINKQYENQIQINTLATLRDTLLPRLISGQLRLPNTEFSQQPADQLVLEKI